MCYTDVRNQRNPRTIRRVDMDRTDQVPEGDKDRIITMLSNQYMSLRIEINEHLRGMYVLCAAIGTATIKI